MCSASNYLLGMTPLEIPAFMTGTVAGMTVWGCVYASIGGAGRNLLKSGVDLEEVVSGRRNACSHGCKNIVLLVKSHIVAQSKRTSKLYGAYLGNPQACQPLDAQHSPC